MKIRQGMFDVNSPEHELLLFGPIFTEALCGCSCGCQNLNRSIKIKSQVPTVLKHTTQTEGGLPVLWVSDVTDMKWQTFAGNLKFQSNNLRFLERNHTV